MTSLARVRPAARDSAPIPSWRSILLAGIAYAVLTVAFTYPQAWRLSTHTGPHYDALFGTWRIAWIAHQLVADPTRLFDANVFFPEANTLAYSDAAMLPALVGAPAIWAGVPPIVVYNSLVLLSFVLAAVGMFVLAHLLTGSPPAAAAAGLIFAFHPYRFAHFSHLELVWTCWIPLSFWALHRVVRSAHWRDGMLLGVFVSLQVLTSVYYGVFLLTALPVVGLALLVGSRLRAARRLLPAAVVAAGVVIVVGGMYAQPYLRSRADVGERSTEEVARWSPTLANYLEAQNGNWLHPRRRLVDAFEGVLLPGIAAVVLALWGLVHVRDRQGLRVAAAYAVVLIMSVDISLGSNGLLYPLLRAWGGPYMGLRVPARMFVITSASLAVLAALGFHALIRTRLGRPIAGFLVVVAMVETASVPLDLAAVPLPSGTVTTWLATQPRGAVFEWPVPRAGNLGATKAPEYMYFSTFHWQPLVNGYSGFHPRSYIDLLDAVVHFPDGSSLRRLERSGVRYVVVHSADDPDRYLEVIQGLAARGLTLEARETMPFEEVAVYSMRARP